MRLFLILALLAAPAAADVIPQHDFRVTIMMKSRNETIVIRARDQNAAREIAEAQYGRARVKAVVRIWK